MFIDIENTMKVQQRFTQYLERKIIKYYLSDSNISHITYLVVNIDHYPFDDFFTLSPASQTTCVDNALEIINSNHRCNLLFIRPIYHNVSGSGLNILYFECKSKSYKLIFASIKMMIIIP
jgi:hypothetical protein